MKNRIILLIFILYPILSNGNYDKMKGKNEKESKESISSIGISTSMQLQLNNALGSLENQLVANYESNKIKVDDMTDIKVNINTELEKQRKSASKLMSYLDANPGKVKDLLSLNFGDLTTLPVGLKFSTSNNSKIMAGILEAQFYENYAELLVFVRIKLQIDGVERDLFFGVDKLKFTRNGFVNNGGFKAVLLGDFIIPGKKWTLKLKGGSGVGDRVYAATKTYIVQLCEGYFLRTCVSRFLSCAKDISFVRAYGGF